MGKEPLIECVPNFSEGQNPQHVLLIKAAIASVKGIRVLHTDGGYDAHRTVITFVGDPEAVVEAAFRGIKKAASLIDMSIHKGKHPRIGATDVCPLIPIQDITLEELIPYSEKLAKRVAEELAIPVYLYEASQTKEYRQKLASIRKGEFEGLAAKLNDERWYPDYGPKTLQNKAGATILGARKLLVAYNINLNTRNVALAKEIAAELREGPDRKGLPGVRAIGWYIAEYGIAQVSFNITDYKKCGIHEVFEATLSAASRRGLMATGCELIGLIPKDAMTAAGAYYASRQGLKDSSDEELIHLAIRSLSLNDIKPFVAEEKILEYKLSTASAMTYHRHSLENFTECVSAAAAVPGSGSVNALSMAQAAALTNKCISLSIDSKSNTDVETINLVAFLKFISKSALQMIALDATAYENVMAVYQLPRNNNSPEAVKDRALAIDNALEKAANVPLKLQNIGIDLLNVIKCLKPHIKSTMEADLKTAILLCSSSVKASHSVLQSNAKLMQNEKGRKLLLESIDICAISKQLERELL